MGRRCRYCGKPAVVYLRYANLPLCGEHFVEYYEKRIRKVLEKNKVKGRILVAVSGGKDSMALLHALKKLEENGYPIEVFAYHIDLGIYDYSKESRNVVLRYISRVKVPLILTDLKKETGFTIPELAELIDRPPCSICGTVKRWFMNKTAYELGFDWIATGHNIDDISTYYLKAFFTQDLETLLRRQEEISPPNADVKLVGRVRPQFYLSERENMLYVELNEIPIVESSCPFGESAPIHRYKTLWEFIMGVNPVAQINFVKTVKKVIPKEEEPELKQCKICGYPTHSTSGICAYCKLMMKARAKKQSNP